MMEGERGWLPRMQEPQRMIRLLYLPERQMGSNGVELDSNIVKVELELKTFHLQEAPSYSALSYTWGCPVIDPKGVAIWEAHTRDSAVTCNGQKVQVTMSLLAALRCVIQRRPGIWLWNDALCIDQGNATEKFIQISQMGEIYSSANETLIWLGPWVPQPFFLHHYYQKFLALGEIDLGTTEARDSALDCIFSGASVWMRLKMMYEIVHMAQLSWFGRTWTFQEYVLSTSSTFFYGQFVFAGQKFRTFVELFFELSKSDQKLAHPLKLLPKHSFWIRLKSRQLISGAPESSDAFASLLDRVYGSHCFTAILLEMLARMSEAKATDPRDRILGLLGVCKVLAGNLGEGIEDGFLKHDQSTFELMASFAKQAVLTVPFLQILRFARHSEEHPNIPSWTPDFIKVPNGTLSTRKYDASLMKETSTRECLHGRRFESFIDSSSSVKFEKLGLRAFPIGSILEASLARQDARYASGTVLEQDYNTTIAILKFCLSLPKSYWNDSRKGNGLWQTLYAGNQAVTELIFRVGLLTGLYLYNHNKPADKVHYALYFLTIADNERLTEILGFDVVDDLRSASQLIDAKGAGRAAHLAELERKRPQSNLPGSAQYLLRLSEDRIGSTMWPCREGDEMWIFQGGVHPFMVRPTDQPNHYRLIGDAYVDGVMDGEVIAEQGDDVAWKTIWLT